MRPRLLQRAGFASQCARQSPTHDANGLRCRPVQRPGDKAGTSSRPGDLDAGIVRTPERRSSLASTDSRTVAFRVVRALTVIVSGPVCRAPGAPDRVAVREAHARCSRASSRARPLMRHVQSGGTGLGERATGRRHERQCQRDEDHLGIVV